MSATPPLLSIHPLPSQCKITPELQQIRVHILKSEPSTACRLIRDLSLSDTPGESISLYSKILSLSNTLQGLEFLYPSVLKACGRLSAFEEVHLIDAHMLKARFQADPFVANAVLRMYLELGEVEPAKQLFERMPDRDVISWNSIIVGCLRAGDVELASTVFDEMPLKDLVSRNSMIDGFMKCGRCDLASEIFGSMNERDVVTWTSMVSGFVLNSRPNESLEHFRRMLGLGVRPDATAVVNALSAVSYFGFPGDGKCIHAYIIRADIELVSGVLGSALVDMYSKCGLVDNAYRVLRNISYKSRVGDWNSMISGFAIQGHGREALEIFHEMERVEIVPDEISFLGILNACSHGGFC